MYKNRTHIFSLFAQKKGQIAILIDPEEIQGEEQLKKIIHYSEIAKIDFFFIGGSTVTKEAVERVVAILKENTTIPIVLFPGSSHQISHQADAILFLSLLSGRNPDYLIGHHILASKELHSSSLEIIPTAYILIDGGTKSSVAYVSQTTPIPANQHQIALQTAIAGAMQGKRVLFFDAGSGANHPVDASLLKVIRTELPNHPIIVGGGIKSILEVEAVKETANIIVIGNHIEKNIDFILDLIQLKKAVHPEDKPL